MRYVIVFVTALLLLSPGYVVAQPQLNIQHYSIEDGLPQKSVVDITQDSKGFMWFATPDMICRFDGVTFHPYGLDEGNNHPVHNNRFDRIKFDANGYLWITTRDGQLFHFDPKLEKLADLKQLPEFKANDFRARSVLTSKYGKTWITTQNMGCFCFRDATLKPTVFNMANHRIGSNNVNTVFEDENKNSWILTANGLYRYSPGLQSIGLYYTGGTGFFCAAETRNSIWFGAAHGLVYRYEKSSGKFYLVQTAAVSAIRSIALIDEEHLFIASSTDFVVYDIPNASGRKFSISTLGHTTFTNIRSCFVDKRKSIWIETDQQGISKFNPFTGAFKHFELKTENFADHPFSPHTMTWEDINGRLWVQQHGGGFGYFDAADDMLHPVADLIPPNSTRFSGILYAGFSDRQGNLWISSKSQGVEKMVFPDPVFRSLLVDSADGNNNVRSIMEDNLHRIWAGTKDQKISIFNSDLIRLGNLTVNGTIGSGAALGGMPYSMITDWKGNVWIGTKGKGVYKLVPNKSSLSYTVHHYNFDKNNPYSLSDDKVYRIFQDNRHRIWIGTYSTGLNLVDDEIDGRFYSYRNLFKNYPIKLARHVRSIGEDAGGMLYLGTTRGLMVFPAKLAENGPAKYRFYPPAAEGKGLSGTDVYDVCVTSSGEIYLAVSGAGIDHVVQKDAAGYPILFNNLSTRNGLISNLTSQVREDHDHHLWLVSESNLMRFFPDENTFENYPDVADAIKGENFSEAGDITSRAGHILLGTTGGLIEIYPERIKKDMFMPYMALTGFQLANRKVIVGPSSPLVKNIDELQTVNLSYKQNFVTIEFAALDFSNTKQLRYAYWLDGVDSTWVTTTERNARYINLAPGNYTFHVRSTNGRGQWRNNERKLEIVVVPAIWQTWWARLLYVLAVLSLFILVSRWIISYYRLKDRLQLEKEQTEMKTSFFTDISHEIRTPLTLIVSPVEHILEQGEVDRSVADQLKMVLKNSKRMLRLVNQILDFRKIQDQLLMVSETAIGYQVTTIATEFFSTIAHKGILLRVNDQTGGKTVWVDNDSLEKMLFNLLSNAVKHTPAGTVVEVNLFFSGEKLALQVKDHGYGMNKEVLRKLFSRFVSYNPDRSNPSTGIGLSIVKEIVDRHGAEIQVESRENEGSSFTILFQTGAAHFAGQPNVVLADAYTDQNAETAETIQTQPTAISNHNETILLIEDDDELRHYIGSLLRGNYKVFEAADGAEALAIAQQEVPDFIISDIMMPKMTGFEFLEALRGKPITSHIPLIFLTAKADPDTELAAYECGADAFITKPFSIKMLQSRIQAIMAQRQRLYTVASPKPVVAETGLPTPRVVSNNERFLNKLREEIEKNISNAGFCVDDLISIMPMSRTVFVKKLRSLTGQSPVEYIRMVKIKYAAMLIDADQYSIKEISHMVGIHDTRYFSQRFKEVMGMLPSEYKKKVASS